MRNALSSAGPMVEGQRSGLVAGLAFPVEVAQQNRLDRGGFSNSSDNATSIPKTDLGGPLTVTIDFAKF